MAFVIEATVRVVAEEGAAAIDASDLIVAVRSLPGNGTTTAAATVSQSWEIHFSLAAGQEVEAAADSLLVACQLTSPDCALSGVTAEGRRRVRRSLQDGGSGAVTLTRPLTSGPLNAQIPNLAGSGVAVSRAARPSCSCACDPQSCMRSPKGSTRKYTANKIALRCPLALLHRVRTWHSCSFLWLILPYAIEELYGGRNIATLQH